MQGKNLPSNWGYLKADYEFKSRLLATAAKFLTEVMKNYVQYNIDFRKQFKYPAFPFLFTELSNQAMLLRCMTHYDMTDYGKIRCYPMPEFPLRYKQDRDLIRHRLDYWILLKTRNYKDIVLLCEHKHEPVYLRQNKYDDSKDDSCPHFTNTKRVQEKYHSDMNERSTELKNMIQKNQELRENMSLWNSCNLILSNLIICPFQIFLPGADDKVSERKVSERYVSKNNFSNWINELTGILSPKPNWNFFWQLSEERQKPDMGMDEWEEEEDGKIYRQKCFGLYAFAHLDQLL